MARIKIKDLPKDMKVSKEEMRKIRGGLLSMTYSAVYLPISASYPTSTQAIRYTGAIEPSINWGTPQYESGCSCKSMGSNPAEAGCPNKSTGCPLIQPI